ncbi:hypothetical protein BO71DRAFT_111761 [Aspergillus ellipticus CBS 707.79]|uniref:Uncharacterized protein n=1 Tax=Aspergillus ellipticus CBS 707.79 TaxID=1448320 RepID=A0A319CX82_9EURO|nr:hypothetical protein BO71DRAFT_111761 [Aspergillus ellipticus CBS 707.79]
MMGIVLALIGPIMQLAYLSCPPDDPDLPTWHWQMSGVLRLSVSPLSTRASTLLHIVVYSLYLPWQISTDVVPRLFSLSLSLRISTYSLH